jgi:hypothetical protein
MNYLHVLKLVPNGLKENNLEDRTYKDPDPKFLRTTIEDVRYANIGILGTTQHHLFSQGEM